MVFLGYRTNVERNEFKLGGTAFLVSVPIFADGRGVSYLVTAKHCLLGQHGIYNKARDGKAYVRANCKDGTAEWYGLNPHWVYHPDDSIDVAVMTIATEDLGLLDAAHIGQQAFATRNVISSEDIGIGDEVFVIGLFTQHYGNQRNIPIARVGTIAAMPEEKVWVNDYGWIDACLIESRSIGGLSGSPVLVCIDALSSLGPNQMLVGQQGRFTPRFFLLGLMHGHWDSNVSSDMVVDDGAGPGGVNMGIAIVIPADKILEVLNDNELAAQRDRLRDLLMATENGQADQHQFHGPP